MITVEQYLDFADKYMKCFNKLNKGCDEVRPLFVEKYPNAIDEKVMMFNRANWNGCDILRGALYCDNFVTDDQIEVKYYFIYDQHHFFIFIKNAFYYITWHKSRGKTDKIECNGKPITLDDYIDLCNKLQIKLPEVK